MKHLKRFRRLTRSNLSPVFAVYSLCCWEVETLVPILFALLSISSFVIMSELPPPPRRDEGASARPSIFSLIPSSSSSCFWLLIGFSPSLVAFSRVNGAKVLGLVAMLGIVGKIFQLSFQIIASYLSSRHVSRL